MLIDTAYSCFVFISQTVTSFFLITILINIAFIEITKIATMKQENRNFALWKKKWDHGLFHPLNKSIVNFRTCTKLEIFVSLLRAVRLTTKAWQILVKFYKFLAEPYRTKPLNKFSKIVVNTILWKNVLCPYHCELTRYHWYVFMFKLA